MKNRSLQAYRQLSGLLSLSAVIAATITPSVQAAEVQIGLRATAIDSPTADFVAQTAGGWGRTPPVLSASAMVDAGISRSFVGADANALTGEMHDLLQAQVGADELPRPGRGASASSGMSMVGSIIMSGGLPPGLATFSTVLEGSYNFGNSIFRYANSAYVEYDGVIGSAYHKIERVYFDPSTSAGLFAFPLTWTLLVHPGERIDMAFTFFAGVISSVGLVEINAFNTFKITQLDLPPGYTYTPDEQGFLSEFHPAAVPEPASSMLTVVGLLWCAWRWRTTLTRRTHDPRHPATADFT